MPSPVCAPPPPPGCNGCGCRAASKSSLAFDCAPQWESLFLLVTLDADRSAGCEFGGCRRVAGTTGQDKISLRAREDDPFTAFHAVEIPAIKRTVDSVADAQAKPSGGLDVC